MYKIGNKVRYTHPFNEKLIFRGAITEIKEIKVTHRDGTISTTVTYQIDGSYEPMCVSSSVSESQILGLDESDS